ncbi:MAG TPA: NUDIX hydrolase YfcD [Deltaproteobacteria bacterium]|nr:NUDIX hydrolase YfcD [Deltaproteobacteria bacterium]
MSRGGFAGRILTVDLTGGTSSVEPLDMTKAEQFGGGLGLSIGLAFENIVPGTTALSPENPIVIGAGPFVGTNLPASSRLFAVSKLPASDSIGWCGAGGMSCGCMLKHAGYDHLIIRGRADRPVLLKVIDDTVELCDAGPLWGRGIAETDEALKKEFGRPSGTISIGPAGENGCSYAMAYVDGISTLGRGGFGSVMGSKNLKAVLVKGSRGIRVADRGRYRTLATGLLDKIRGYPYLKEWQELGLLKSLPAIQADEYRRIRKRRIACISCPIGDKDLIEIADGELKGLAVCSSSAVNLLTPLMYKFADYREAIKLTAVLDDLGMDMFEFFGIMSYLKDLLDKGIINPDRLDAPLVMNSLPSLAAWANLVAGRQGVGDVLAGGVSSMLREFGDEAGTHAPPVVRGMLPYVGPDAPLPWSLFGTMELGQLLDPRGPHVAAGGSPTYFAKRPLDVFPKHMERMGIPGDAAARILPGQGGHEPELNVGRLLKHSHTWFTILGSLGVCARAQVNRFYDAGLCAELYGAVTGIRTGVADLRSRADRAWTLLRACNIREGFSKQHDLPPLKWFGPSGFRDYMTELPIGSEDVTAMVEEYYDEQGWDRQTGEPLPQRIRELGLTSLYGEEIMAERIGESGCPASSTASNIDPSLSQEEEVAIVDEHNNVVGSALRAVMRKRGLIHRATYILVFDTQGRLFVQERTLTKDIFPGCYDLCTGGVVLSGEDYEESALRELREEIGLEGVELASHFDFYGEYEGQRVWGRVFSCVSDGPFVLQPEEVAGGAFHSIEEVKSLMRDMPCTPDSVYVFLRFLDSEISNKALVDTNDRGEAN